MVLIHPPPIPSLRGIAVRFVRQRFASCRDGFAPSASPYLRSVWSVTWEVPQGAPAGLPCVGPTDLAYPYAKRPDPQGGGVGVGSGSCTAVSAEAQPQRTAEHGPQTWLGRAGRSRVYPEQRRQRRPVAMLAQAWGLCVLFGCIPLRILFALQSHLRFRCRHGRSFS